MIAQRVFLDWNRPCLASAAAWVIERASPGNPIDLRRTMCVLPGARAGRLLLAHLLEQARCRDAALLPPRVLTPGAMVDQLLMPGGACATNTESLLAWLHVLRSSDVQALAPLIPSPPEAEDMLAWHGMASMISRLHDELAGARLSFDHVAHQADRMNMPAEAARWNVLHSLCDRYQQILVQCELIDPHLARVRALGSAASAVDFDSIVLIGVTDLNAVQRDALTPRAGIITALVHAPAELAERFDEFGCVKPDAWASRHIDIDESQLVIADRPADQAREAMQALAKLDGRFAPQQITIGLGDADLADQIARTAHWAGLQTHSAHGRALAATPPVRLLQAVADWISERRFVHFAALLRHPDIEKSIAHERDPRAVNWLTLLDTYFTDHLQGRIADQWLGSEQTQRQLKKVHDAANRLLLPLISRSESSRRALAQWVEPVLQVLINVYGSADESTAINPLSIDACHALRDSLALIASAQAPLQPLVDSSTAIRLLLAHAAAASITDEPRRDQIEMLGWLELHLDPAPALILAGVNDGAIPQTLTADAFLPDSLRSALGLADNQRRYARDAYLLSAILKSRPHVTIIAGRRTARGEPLSPSRLLLACDDDTIVKRIRVMCKDQTAWHVTPMIGQPAPATETHFVVPPLPTPLRLPEKLNITAFRDYIACPYRFALRWVLALDGFDDGAAELDPLGFGKLAHEVLCSFGTDKSAANSVDPEIIEKFLLKSLAEHSRKSFGDHPLPAVRLQIARLEQRLRSFAQFQARHRAEGWVIDRCEWKPDPTPLDIPGAEPMHISGRIDRIDRREATDEWLILDYKTSESGESPHKTHLGRQKLPSVDELEWEDLQLPLYWFLARNHGIAGNVKLGYLVLPKRANSVELLTASWSSEHLECAVEKARDIVRDIRTGKFTLRNDFHKPFDDFARICQTLVFDDEGDDGEEVAA